MAKNRAKSFYLIRESQDLIALKYLDSLEGINDMLALQIEELKEQSVMLALKEQFYPEFLEMKKKQEKSSKNEIKNEDRLKKELENEKKKNKEKEDELKILKDSKEELLKKQENAKKIEANKRKEEEAEEKRIKALKMNEQKLTEERQQLAKEKEELLRKMELKEKEEQARIKAEKARKAQEEEDRRFEKEMQEELKRKKKEAKKKKLTESAKREIVFEETIELAADSKKYKVETKMAIQKEEVEIKAEEQLPNQVEHSISFENIFKKDRSLTVQSEFVEIKHAPKKIPKLFNACVFTKEIKWIRNRSNSREVNHSQLEIKSKKTNKVMTVQHMNPVDIIRISSSLKSARKSNNSGKQVSFEVDMSQNEGERMRFSKAAVTSQIEAPSDESEMIHGGKFKKNKPVSSFEQKVTLQNDDNDSKDELNISKNDNEAYKAQLNKLNEEERQLNESLLTASGATVTIISRKLNMIRLKKEGLKSKMNNHQLNSSSKKVKEEIIEEEESQAKQDLARLNDEIVALTSKEHILKQKLAFLSEGKEKDEVAAELRSVQREKLKLKDLETAAEQRKLALNKLKERGSKELKDKLEEFKAKHYKPNETVEDKTELAKQKEKIKLLAEKTNQIVEEKKAIKTKELDTFVDKLFNSIFDKNADDILNNPFSVTAMLGKMEDLYDDDAKLATKKILDKRTSSFVVDKLKLQKEGETFIKGDKSKVLTTNMHIIPDMEKEQSRVSLNFNLSMQKVENLNLLNELKSIHIKRDSVEQIRSARNLTFTGKNFRKNLLRNSLFGSSFKKQFYKLNKDKINRHNPILEHKRNSLYSLESLKEKGVEQNSFSSENEVKEPEKVIRNLFDSKNSIESKSSDPPIVLEKLVVDKKIEKFGTDLTFSNEKKMQRESSQLSYFSVESLGS